MQELNNKPPISRVGEALLNVGYVIESKEQDIVIEWIIIKNYITKLEEALFEVSRAADAAVKNTRYMGEDRASKRV